MSTSSPRSRASATPPTAPSPAPAAPAGPEAAPPPARRRAIELDGAEGQVEVVRAAYGRTTEAGARVRVPLFAGPAARVRVAAGITRNMGDYNSLRVDVAVELPCHPCEEEVLRAYGVASGWVDGFMEREMALAVGDPPPDPPEGAPVPVAGRPARTA